jgi:hypothetical protein
MNALVDLIPSAISEAQTARMHLALNLASEFARSPENFDPKQLERLGREGLGVFLTGVGHAARAKVASPTLDKGSETVRAQTGPARIIAGGDLQSKGWKHLHRRERSFWLTGLVAGLRAGGWVTATGWLILLLADHVVPLAKEMLA